MKTKMIIWFISAALCYIFSIMTFTFKGGDASYREYYGGDAYTGIQHAAAETGTNVYELIKLTKKCFGGLFLVLGTSCIAIALPSSCQIKKTEEQAPSPSNDTPSNDTPSEESSIG